MKYKLASLLLASTVTFSEGRSAKGSKRNKGCKRHPELKPTRKCKEKNDYNGLQDIDVVAPGLSPDMVAVGRCVAAFQSSGFDPYDFENYSKWINDDTTMMLADTGVWRGVEAVLEYVQIALSPRPCENDPFLTNITPRGLDNMLPVVADGDECRLLFTDTVLFQNQCLFPGDVEVTIGNRYWFTIVDDSSVQATIQMKRWDVYIPPGPLAYIASAAKTTEYATKICETMQSSCSKTFERNCYNNLEDNSEVQSCVDELLSLPATDNDGPTFNGKSYGCRFLHSILAQTNSNHCPHISFDPEFDPNCFAKCQQAAGITNADMFHPIELGFMAGEAAKAGLPVEQWRYVENSR